MCLFLGFVISNSLAFGFDSDSNVSEDLVLKYSDDRYWQYLLHYSNNKSKITAKSFFLSDAKNGKVDLKLELQKTIEAFFYIDNLDDRHAICRYPARFKWIKSKFNINDDLFPKPHCKNFDYYIQSISLKSVSISFASENLSNPTSMMGHPFLKIQGEKNGTTTENVLTYFGDYSNDNILKFYLKSVTTGVKGTFLVEPYKKKLNFYNNTEKRTVWELKLNLTQSQIDDLVLHIWELYKVDAKYHFIYHNCVEALADLLKIGGVDGVEDNNLFLTPVELVNKIYELGYINDIAIYPSYDYEFRMVFGTFDKKSKQKIYDILNFNYKIDYKNPQEAANIIYASRIGLKANSLKDKSFREKYDKIIGEIDEDLAKLPKNNIKYNIKNPIIGAKTSQISVGYGEENSKKVTEIGFYPVYNSIENNNSQYFNEFELKLLNTEMKYYEGQKKPVINNLDIMKIRTIIDRDRGIGGLSSGFRINFEREDNFINTNGLNTNRLYPNIETNFGYGKNFFDDKALAYFLVSPSYSYYRNQNNPYIYSEFGAFLRNFDNFKTYAKYRKYFSKELYKYDEEVSISQIFFVGKGNFICSFSKINGDFSDVKKVDIKYQYNF